MSYASFGDINPWTVMSAHLWDPQEVYVLRLKTRNAKIRSPEDLLVFVKAIGQSQNLQLDVSGAGTWQASGMPESESMLDLVFTTTEGGVNIPFVADDAKSMAAKLQAHADVRRVFPDFIVTEQQFGPIVSPKDAIDHWRGEPILWNHLLNDKKGGPTDSFAKPADYNLVRGKADDGARATPITPNPIFAPPDHVKIPESGISPTMAFVGGVVIGLVSWSLLGRSQARTK